MVTAEEFLEQAIITEAIKDRARVEAAQYRSPATVQPTVQQPVYAAPQPIYYVAPQQSGSGWTIAALCVAALAIVIAYATLTGYLGVTPLTATQL